VDVVLVDSSVWVNVEHGRISLFDFVTEEDTIATCPTVVLEVLRGTRGEGRYYAAREFLLDAEVLDAPTPLIRFEQAARIYLRCRDAGIAPSATDCLIAASAVAHNAELLHQDSDFDHIARVIPALRLFSRS
jgi:predicted nucleic acid-binding protein